MLEPKALQLGDACPNCSGELRAAPVPTDEQLAKANDRENPVPLARQYDNASKEVRAELGNLYRCRECGYVARFRQAAARAVKAAKDGEK